MKRIFSLLLIGCILALSLAPAVSAAELPTSELIDILDTDDPNGSGSRRVYRKTGALNVVASLGVEPTFTFYYIDVLFRVPSGYTPASVWLSNSSSGAVHTDLTLINISGDFWRAYGDTEYTNGGFFLHFTGGMPWIEFSSVRVSPSPVSGFDERAKCEISAYNFHQTINYVPTDLINYRNFLGSSTPELNTLTLLISCDNWRKYDYLDYCLSCDVASISTISAYLGDTAVPFTSSFVTSSGSIENHYDIVIRLDLRNVPRTSTEGLIVDIRGSVNLGSDNFISMEGCRGFVFGSVPNPLISIIDRCFGATASLLNNIRLRLDDIFEAVQGNVASGDHFKDESSGLISDLDSVSSSLNSVQKPDLEILDLTGLTDSPDASYLMSGLFAPFMANDAFFMIFMINIILCLVAYLLYGKG